MEGDIGGIQTYKSKSAMEGDICGVTPYFIIFNPYKIFEFD